MTTAQTARDLSCRMLSAAAKCSPICSDIISPDEAKIIGDLLASHARMLEAALPESVRLAEQNHDAVTHAAGPLDSHSATAHHDRATLLEAVRVLMVEKDELLIERDAVHHVAKTMETYTARLVTELNSARAEETNQIEVAKLATESLRKRTYELLTARAEVERLEQDLATVRTLHSRAYDDIRRMKHLILCKCGHRASEHIHLGTHADIDTCGAGDCPCINDGTYDALDLCTEIERLRGELASGWQDEKPIDGDWWCAPHPSRRKMFPSYAAVLSVKVHCQGVDVLDPGIRLMLAANSFFASAKWKRREVPADPFAVANE